MHIATATSILAPMVDEKYAVGEYERRFLLDHRPHGMVDPRGIVDEYINDTRLRLRTVDWHDTGQHDQKLGHKRRVDENDPTAIMCTSLYLDDNEVAVLSLLPSRRLAKTRWRLNIGTVVASVDVFEGSLEGLILMEVDLGAPALLEEFTPPSWVGPDVTRTERFTGGGLAGLSFKDLAADISLAHTG
jgi:CYTH domain-containing protein